MEKITKVFDVYNFEELDKDIQEKLIEKQQEQDAEFYCEFYFKEDLEEKASILLKKYFGDKATLKNIYYSFSYCQGDGAMIEFDLYYYNKYVKIKHSGFYYHSKCFTIDTYELTDKQEEQLKNKIIAMNEELEKIGWELVDYKPSKNECINLLKENKYYKNGNIFEY